MVNGFRLETLLTFGELTFVVYVAVYVSIMQNAMLFCISLTTLKSTLMVLTLIYLASGIPVLSERIQTRLLYRLKWESHVPIIKLSISIFLVFLSIKRLLAINDLTFFYFECAVLATSLWLFLLYAIKYRFQLIPVTELEELLDDIALGNLISDDDIKRKYERVFRPISLEEWKKQNMNAAANAASQITRLVREVKQILASPNECRVSEKDDTTITRARIEKLFAIRAKISSAIEKYEEQIQALQAIRFAPLFYASPSAREYSECLGHHRTLTELIADIKANRKVIKKALTKVEKEIVAKGETLRNSKGDVV